jgi:hypothetical protein
MECEAFMPIEPWAHCGVLVGGGVVDQDVVHELAGRNFDLDGDALDRTDRQAGGALAIMAPVLCVASPGGSSCVMATIRSATSCPSGFTREGRVLSRSRPSKPSWQQAIEALLHEALLPAPDTGLGLAGPTHDLVRADPVGAAQDDFGAPNVFLGGVAVSESRLQDGRDRTLIP